MNKRIRRLIIGLTLTAAATGTALTAATVTTSTAAADTYWGADLTTDDTHWGTPPTGDVPDTSGTIETDPIVIPLDTHWG